MSLYKSRARALIKTGVSAALLAAALYSIDIASFFRQLSHLEPHFILYALLFYSCLQWLSCIRWQIVLAPSGHRLATWQLMGSYFAGMFLNIFLPGAVGGDAYRVLQVSRRTQDSEIGLVSVFLERFTGLVALSLMGILGVVPLFKLIDRWDIILLFLGCVGALAGGTLLIASPGLLRWLSPGLNRLHLEKLVTRVAKIQALLYQFIQHRRALFLSITLSLILQISIVFYHYLLAQQLGIAVTFLELLVFVPIVVVITMLPISLGGIGIKEGLWIYLFTQVGQTAEAALLFSITLTVLSWLLSLPGAIILAANSQGLRRYLQTRSASP